MEDEVVGGQNRFLDNWPEQIGRRRTTQMMPNQQRSRRICRSGWNGRTAAKECPK